MECSTRRRRVQLSGEIFPVNEFSPETIECSGYKFLRLKSHRLFSSGFTVCLALSFLFQGHLLQVPGILKTTKNKKAKPNAHISLLDFPSGSCQQNCDSFCVQCSSCKTWFHDSFLNLPNGILAVLRKIAGISWCCGNSEQKGQLPVTEADIDSLSDNIQSLNTHIQQELSEIRNDINQLK